MTQRQVVPQRSRQQPVRRNVVTNPRLPVTQPYSEEDLIEEDLIEEDDAYYPTRPHSSVRRYNQPPPREEDQIIQQGGRRLVIHQQPPPQKVRIHWSLVFGFAMIVTIGGIIAFSYAQQWWNTHQLDSTYGMPRTYQIDALVYGSDTPEKPSHYIFLNLNGTVMIIELPHDDNTHARIYRGPVLMADNAASMPVVGEFKMVNGKIEMVVHIGDQQYVYINNGQQFIPQTG